MIASSLTPIFAAADPQLPGRDVLLDDEDMRVRFGERLGLDGPVCVDEITRVRVKYRPGESLRVLHRIQVAGQEHLISSRMRAAGADALYSEAAEHEVGCDALRGVVFDPALQCVFWTFPNDRRLALPAEPLAQHPLIRRLFAGHQLDVSVAGYAPERAVVYRIADCHSGRFLGFAKVFRTGGAAEARAVLEALAAANRQTAAPVRVPRVLGGDDDAELLVTEALSGTHLNRLEDGELTAAFVALGIAMGRLHALPAPDGLAFDDQCAAPAMAEAVELLALARPDVADVARRLAEQLTACRPDSGDPVWIHGDLNSRNWMARPLPAAGLRGGVPTVDVGLIDFDQPTCGPAGVDVGGVLAWMRTRTLVGAWSARRERELEAALLRGYGMNRPMPTIAELRWYRAEALLVQRAVRAATRVRQRQLAVLPQMLSAAARDLEVLRHA